MCCEAECEGFVVEEGDQLGGLSAAWAGYHDDFAHSDGSDGSDGY